MIGNDFLNAFFQKREMAARKPAEPNPSKHHKGVKPMTTTTSLAHILEKKPPAKVVLEYIRERINKTVEQQEYI